MDSIEINGLLVRCRIGVTEGERSEKQDVIFNIRLFVDLSLPCRTDKFEHTVDYRAVKKKVLTMAENSEYHLLEALAEAAARVCLEDPAVLEVEIGAEKPSALRFARSAGVRIVRRNG